MCVEQGFRTLSGFQDTVGLQVVPQKALKTPYVWLAFIMDAGCMMVYKAFGNVPCRYIPMQICPQQAVDRVQHLINALGQALITANTFNA